jgi:type I restriction enzyme R subunit
MEFCSLNSPNRSAKISIRSILSATSPSTSRRLTRRERAENVKKRNYFAKYGEQARAVLLALLEKYADEGIETIESPGVLKVQPLDKFGTPVEIVRLFGGPDAYKTAVKELESALYTLVK